MARSSCLARVFAFGILFACGSPDVAKPTATAAAPAVDATHVRFVVFDLAWVASNIDAPPAAIAQWSQSSPDATSVKPAFRHILLRPKGSDLEAKARAEKVIARIAAGEAFAKVAREVSDDEASAVHGGTIPGGDVENYVEPIQRAFADLGPGQSSKAPVQTDFGYHIVRKDTLAESREMAFRLANGRKVAQDLAGATLARWQANPAQDAQSLVDDAIRTRLPAVAARDERRPRARYMDKATQLLGVSGECGVLQGGAGDGRVVQLIDAAAATMAAPPAGAVRDLAPCEPVKVSALTVEALAEALQKQRQDMTPEDRSTYVKTPRHKSRPLEIFAEEERARPLDGLSPPVGRIEEGNLTVDLKPGDRKAALSQKLAGWLDGVAHPPGTFFVLQARPGNVNSVLVREPVIVDDRDVRSAATEESPDGAMLAVTWSPEAQTRLADITRGIVGRRIVILSNNETLMVARVVEPLRSATMRVVMPKDGDAKKRADALARQLSHR